MTERPDSFPADRFSWIDPDSPAARHWRELRDEGDEEALRRYEEMLGGPPGFCESGWRSEQDVAEHYDHVPPYSPAAESWRKLKAKGDGAGLKRLEERIEELETVDEVRALTFCGCGYARLSFGESKLFREAAEDPGELLHRRFRLADGTPVDEGPEDVYRIHPARGEDERQEGGRT